MRKSWILMLVILLLTSLAIAQEPAKLTVGGDDTIRSILKKQVGQQVSLKLDSGDEISGVVRFVGDSVVHLGGLTGKEFYDAVIDPDEIAAVIIRVR